jgi:hypothetical protein
MRIWITEDMDKGGKCAHRSDDGKDDGMIGDR